MAAQHALTQRFTAEFCIRPYLLHRQGDTLARLRDWAQDDNAHVRRLVSEGTRPRLPWAPRLPAFQKDPQLALPLRPTSIAVHDDSHMQRQFFRNYFVF